MTTDLALNAIKAWITYRTTVYTSLASIPIHLRDSEDEKEPPLIIIKETGAEEHPILRGVLTIGIEVALVTVPGAADEDATTEEASQALNSDLFNILADTQLAIGWCDQYPGLRVFDIRGISPTNEIENSNRVTRFSLTMTCCPRTS